MSPVSLWNCNPAMSPLNKKINSPDLRVHVSKSVHKSFPGKPGIASVEASADGYARAVPNVF